MCCKRYNIMLYIITKIIKEKVFRILKHIDHSLLMQATRHISFSLLSCADDEEKLLNYIYNRQEKTIPMEQGRKLHANFSEEDIKINIAMKSYVDGRKVYLNPHDISNTYLMYRVLHNNDRFKKILVGKFVFEQKLILSCKIGDKNFFFKAYIDILNPDIKTIIELKTTNSFKPYSSIDKYKYDMQLYLYKTACDYIYNTNFNVKIIFLNKINVNRIIFCNFSPSLFDSGLKRFNHLLQNFIEITKKNKIQHLFFF